MSRHIILTVLLLGCCDPSGPIAMTAPAVVIEGSSAGSRSPGGELVSSPYKFQDSPDVCQGGVCPANYSEIPNSCQCGADCDCADCQCPECPHRVVKESLTVAPDRYLAVISAEWCGPCRAIHDKYSGTPGVRFVDVDRERGEAARLWGGTRIAGRPAMADGAPAVVPAFVLVVDGAPVKRWSAPTRHEPWIEGMRDFAGPFATGASPGEHDAEPQEAGEPGEPPAWCVRVHIDGRGSIGSGTGVVVSRGLVLTNRHVAQVPGRVRVRINGQWRLGSRRSYAAVGDLALIAVDCSGVTPVSVASSVSDGQPVTTHGYAAGVVYRSQRTTFRSVPIRESNAVDARSCSGESGGPVVDSDGGLVGLIYGADVMDNPDEGRGLIVDLASIRSFLAREGVL